MEDFFNADNKVFSFLGIVGELVMANLLCLLCCLPILTIGPALAALYYTAQRIVQKRDSHLFKRFFHSFRQNLKQGILLHLLLTAVGAVLAFDLYATNVLGESYRFCRYLFCFFLMLMAIFLLIAIYIYPLLAYFDNTVKNIIRNALYLAIHYLRKSVLMLVIAAAIIGLLFLPVEEFQKIYQPLFLLLGLSGIAYFHSLFQVKILEEFKDADREAD